MDEYTKGKKVCLDGVHDAYYCGEASEVFAGCHVVKIGHWVVRREHKSILEECVDLNGEVLETIVHDSKLSGEWRKLDSFIYEVENRD